jgi:hypothetical protein
MNRGSVTTVTDITSITDFTSLMFQSCYSIISSPSISMWINSKFNDVSELRSTFSYPRFQQGVSV